MTHYAVAAVADNNRGLGSALEKGLRLSQKEIYDIICEDYHFTRH